MCLAACRTRVAPRGAPPQPPAPRAAMSSVIRFRFRNAKAVFEETVVFDGAGLRASALETEILSKKGLLDKGVGLVMCLADTAAGVATEGRGELLRSAVALWRAPAQSLAERACATALSLATPPPILAAAELEPHDEVPRNSSVIVRIRTLAARETVMKPRQLVAAAPDEAAAAAAASAGAGAPAAAAQLAHHSGAAGSTSSSISSSACVMLKHLLRDGLLPIAACLSAPPPHARCALPPPPPSPLPTHTPRPARCRPR